MSKTVFNFTLALMALSMATGCAETSETPQKDAVTAGAETASQTQTTTPEASNESATSSMSSSDEPAVTVRSADSHTHGGAELAIVLEEKRVTVELESPLYNLLRFEHHPETAAQKERAELAEKQLSQAASLFVFNSEASCKVLSDIAVPELFEEEHSEHNDHDDHDDHDKHADHDDHKDHDSTHKDVLLQYEFQCADPSSLSEVKVNLFEFFEDMVDIDVTYLGPATQKQVSLTRQKTQMNLSR